jgi:DNA replication protein DnaC
MESPLNRQYPTRDDTCETHGAFSSTQYLRDRWTGCPKCADEAEATRKAEAERKQRQDRIDARLRTSGLDGRFEDAMFENFVVATAGQQKVLDACRQYVATMNRDTKSGLWLIGPPGTGKTHLGSAMVRYAIEQRDVSAEIHSGREIVRMLRATWGNRERGRTMDGRAVTEDGLIEDFGRLSLLVIDEVGASFGSESEQVQLFDIIDLRYRYERPTILLSNLPAKGLKEAIGDRSYDRLREGAQVLVCNWDSHRGHNQAAKPALEVVK